MVYYFPPIATALPVPLATVGAAAALWIGRDPRAPHLLLQGQGFGGQVRSVSRIYVGFLGTSWRIELGLVRTGMPASSQGVKLAV